MDYKIAFETLTKRIKELEQSLKEAEKESENCKLVKECAIEELSAANTKLKEMREGLKSIIGECSPYELRDTFLKVKIQKLLKKED